MYPTLGAVFRALILVVVFAVQPVRAQFEPLAVNIPSSSNAVALFDVEGLFASELAKKEGWQGKYEQAFATGLCAIPPFTNRMILAAEIEYESMRPRWEVVVADLAETRNVAMIARLSKGVIDPVANYPAVALRDDSYVVELADKRLAAMAPANRQSVARWLREVQARTAPALSPYLKGSLVASEISQIVETDGDGK